MICKEKRSYFCIEEAKANSMTNQKVYQCPNCGKFHLTSRGNKNKKRFQKYKWNKK
jgi:predicted RNA-binding Zn-ribbon protein involved in translation (DUF1610 family)